MIIQKKKGIDFFSSPYNFEVVEKLEKINVPAYKIGSGDITWLEFIRFVALKKKPILIAAGASTLDEINDAIKTIRETENNDIILMQCVTNYPSKIESANIRAMNAMAKTFDVLVGYSDHTIGDLVPLASVARGACVIEKHFTDDRKREGPDHPHAMEPKELKEMVEKIRLIEKALGSPAKELYDEEKQTVILQRRCLRAAVDLPKGTSISAQKINVLRPAPIGSLAPKYKDSIIGKKTRSDIKKGEPITWENLS
ncbi:MAG: N-acetylneuraminate synthase family protein [archaeon]